VASNRKSRKSQSRGTSTLREDEDQTLEIARRIARDALDADHRALEIDPPNWSALTVNAKKGAGALVEPLYGS